MRLAEARRLAIAAAAMLALTGCVKPRPKTAEELACADPAAVSRVNFRFAVDRQGTTPLPGADVMTDIDGVPQTVRRKVVVSGRDIRDVRFVYAEGLGGPHPSIAFQFTDAGAKKLSEATGPDNLGQRLALVVDGKLIVTPMIQGPIPAGTMQLTTSADPREVEAMADAIRVAARGCVPPPP